MEAIIEKRLATRPPSVERTEIAFFGGNFTGLPPETQEMYLSIAHRHLSVGRVDGIRLSTRPDCVDTPGVSLLKRFGVGIVELGVQSFSDRVLAAAGRGHDAADSLRAIELLGRSGIGFILQLMTGLPESGPAEELESARIAADAGPRGVRIFPAVVLEGTPLADMYRAGSYRPLSLEEGVERCKTLVDLFSRRGIPVIRTGLHPLKPGELPSVLAGPYHPSFGYLVKSRLRRDELERTIARRIAVNGPGPVVIALPRECRGEYLGKGGENISYLEEKFKPVPIVWDRVKA